MQDAPPWRDVPIVEPITQDQVGSDPLSDIIILEDHIVTCCVTGTMHIWWRDNRPQDSLHAALNTAPEDHATQLIVPGE